MTFPPPNPPQAVCMGEILIDMMGTPAVADVADAQAFHPKPGGAPANVAVALRRLGVPSAFAGKVGDDAFGRLLRRTLEHDGVDVSSLATSKTQPTTLAFVAMDDRGVPSFSFYRHPGADLSLHPEDVRTELFDAARVFHFGSLSLVAPPAYDATLHALALAKERGLFTTYDPNYRPALWKDKAAAQAKMREPLTSVDLLKVSEEELGLLSGESGLNRGCEAIAEAGPAVIVVTRGAKGLYAWNRGETVEVAGRAVEVVDTTGCGDASMAGVVASLLRDCKGLSAGAPIPQALFADALDYANRCAALTATRLGAIPALPTADDVGAFFE